MLNRVTLIGRLGKDPELLEMGGKPMCRLRVATAYREKTEWHDVVVWGARAQACARYLVTGRTVYVDGRLQARSWKSEDGQRHYRTEVIAHSVLFLDRPESPDRTDGEIPTDAELGIPPEAALEGDGPVDWPF